MACRCSRCCDEQAAAEGLYIYEQMMDMRFGGMILCSLCGYGEAE